MKAQLASTDKQLHDTTATLDRCLQAFEQGTMSAHLCANRVDELTTRRQELTQHRQQIHEQLQATTVKPQTGDNHHAAQIIQDAIRTGERSATKTCSDNSSTKSRSTPTGPPTQPT